MADIDVDSAVPVNGGIDVDSATPVSGGGGALGGANAAISEGGDNTVEKHVTRAAQSAYDFLNKHGHPDLAQAAYDAIYKGGPHSKTDLALMGLTAMLPAVGEGAEALSSEVSPVLKGTMDAISTLKAPGLKGAAVRAGTTAAGGAAVGGATGEGASQGAVEGATMSGLGELPEAGQSAAKGAYDSIVDKPGLISGARDAAADAETANAKNLQTAETRAIKESTAQRNAENAAIEDTSKRNMADRKKQYEAAQEAVAKGQAAPATLQQAQDVSAATAEKMAQQSAPAVRDRIIHEATGRSPEQTEAAVHAGPEVSPEGVEVPGPEFIARKKAYLDASYGPTKRMQDELGRQYDTVLGPYLSNPVEDTSPIGAAVDNEVQFAQENNVAHSSQVRTLLKNAKALSPGDSSNVSAVIPPEDLKQLSPRDLAQAQDSYDRGKRIVYTTERGGTNVIEPDQFALNKPTVAQLRGLRSQASDLVATSAGAHDKSAAAAIREATEGSLESAGVPGVKDLNAKYATFKNLFGRDFYRGIASAKDPIDAAPLLFNEPQRAARLVGNSTPEQQQTLRQIYGDWVNRDGGKVVDLKTQKPVLEKLFPGTKLADPKSWIHLPDKLVRAQDLMQDDPTFNQQVMQMAGGERRKAATAIVQDLMGEVKKLGPAGQPIMQQVSQAKSPEDAANMLITALTGMKPEDAVHAMAAMQQSPEEAAKIAGASIQQTQRSQAANFQPQDPNQAAVGAIQQGKMGKTGPGDQAKSYLIQKAPKMLPLYGTFVGLDLLLGKTPGMWQLGMASLGIAMTAGNLMKRAFVNSLKDPANAARFWAAANAPAEQTSKSVMAMGVTRLLAASGLNAFTHDAQNPNATNLDPPIPPDPPPPEKAPLPNVMTAYRTAANEHNDDKMKEIRSDVVKRIKSGEWQKLPPDQQKKLAPWMREMFGPKSSEALAG
jgi:hypothetical protein